VLSISLSQWITWLIVGALAGSLAGLVVKRSRQGFGHFTNLGIGLVGAVLGGVLFRLMGVNLGLGAVSVSLEDLVAAFLGSLLFLLILRFVRKRRGG
jgi:uncharacterized membrane protein YeaQ/YmgE (transglycosylase-associated protein family)